MTDRANILKRKADHLKHALSDEAQIGSSGFEKYRFVHNALPEIDFAKIDTSTFFLGKKVAYPFFISSMTGGSQKGEKLNINLAKAAQKFNIAFAVGSQRIALIHPEFEPTFKRIRKYAPGIPIMANLGAVQLNYGFEVSKYLKAVDMIAADGLIIHLNPIQEVIQPEGDTNWGNLLPKIEKLVKISHVPVVVKEVGFGLSRDVAKRLYNIGVRIFDTAGWGGTSWAYVEGQRGKADGKLAELFSGWGIPSAESIKQCRSFKMGIKSVKERNRVVILGSGGIRTGLDIAKVIALGADLAGLAAPFGRAALVSEKEVEKLITRLSLELRVTMFGVGAGSVSDLKRIKLLSC